MRNTLLLLAVMIVSPLSAKAQTFAAYAAPASTTVTQTWLQNHESYVSQYWHSAFLPLPKPRRLGFMQFQDVVPPVTPTDVYKLGTFGSSAWSYGVTNNFDVGACVERELHQGAWLAGGCKDVLYLLHADAAGNIYKAAHIGGAIMSNAQHGNMTYQIKAGVDLNTLGATIENAIILAAPNLDITPPPWVQQLGNAITFDGALGYLPVHDASVNGNLTYGIMANVNVPISTTFEWIAQGL